MNSATDTPTNPYNTLRELSRDRKAAAGAPKYTQKWPSGFYFGMKAKLVRTSGGLGPFIGPGGSFRSHGRLQKVGAGTPPEALMLLLSGYDVFSAGVLVYTAPT